MTDPTPPYCTVYLESTDPKETLNLSVSPSPSIVLTATADGLKVEPRSVDAEGTGRVEVSAVAPGSGVHPPHKWSSQVVIGTGSLFCAFDVVLKQGATFNAAELLRFAPTHDKKAGALSGEQAPSVEPGPVPGAEAVLVVLDSGAVAPAWLAEDGSIHVEADVSADGDGFEIEMDAGEGA